MNMEKLQALLAAGGITQEAFDDLVKDMNLEPTVEPEPVIEPTEPKKEVELDETIEKLLQSKIDKALSQERKEKALEKKTNAELKKQIERLQKKMMTDEEAKQMEFEEQQRELEEQRRELTLEKNKMYAVKALKKAEISDTEETLALVERLVVSCEHETDIDDLVTILKDWNEKSVKAEVEKRFRANGYTPKSSDSLNGGVNPFKKETFNLTEQIRITNDNPELAAKLRAAAGK